MTLTSFAPILGVATNQGANNMGKLPPAVTARVMRGAQLSMILGQLIYEGAQPYMHLIDPTSGELSDARIALDAQRLKLIEEEQAGRPALFYCRDILVDPRQ